MQPGLNRAIPMAILGFMFGALLVIVLRGLQQLDPLWAPGPGIVIATIFTAAFFLWGIGAFDPRLSVHGEAHDDEHPVAEAPASPPALLSASIWQLATLLLIVLIALAAFALVGGLTLTTTQDPLGSTTGSGYFTLALPFGGPEIALSELVVFAAFVIVMFLTLAAVAGGIGWLMHFLARSINEVKNEPPPGAPALTSGGAAVVSAPPALMDTVKTLVISLIVFLVLFFLFYYVLIGLVLPNPRELLFLLSLVNAIIFTLLIMRPTIVLTAVGRIAGWLARVLRRLPVIFQR
jgi:hypothetical protein